MFLHIGGVSPCLACVTAAFSWHVEGGVEAFSTPATLPYATAVHDVEVLPDGHTAVASLRDSNYLRLISLPQLTETDKVSAAGLLATAAHYETLQCLIMRIGRTIKVPAISRVTQLTMLPERPCLVSGCLTWPDKCLQPEESIQAVPAHAAVRLQLPMWECLVRLVLVSSAMGMLKDVQHGGCNRRAKK